MCCVRRAMEKQRREVAPHRMGIRGSGKLQILRADASPFSSQYEKG